MSENTSLAIVFSILILTVGSCLMLEPHDAELTKREKERTKQIQIQAQIDSLKIVTNFGEKNYGKKD